MKPHCAVPGLFLSRSHRRGWTVPAREGTRDLIFRGLASYLLATLPFALACAPDKREARAPESQREATAGQTGSGPDHPNESIRLEQLAILGDTAGPGYVEFIEDVVRDNLGRYWVGEHQSLKVFDADGRYLRTVGRAGHGPMEFGYARPIYVDGSGHVHIVDITEETIVSSTFALVQTRRLLPAQAEAFAVFPDADRYVVNMWFRGGELIGHPLHIVEDAKIVASFGNQDPSLANSRGMPFKARRVVTVGESGRIYTATRYEYNVEVWTRDGEFAASMAGPTLNEPPARPDPITLENPPPNSIVALQEDPQGRLWVLIRERREDWRKAVDPVTDARGRPGLRLKNGLESIFRGRIDVVDPSTGTIVAQWRGDQLLIGFADHGLVYEDKRLEDGTPRAVVWRVGMKGEE